MWCPGLRGLPLLQGFAVKELHISEDELVLRLRQLALLLPDLAAKISVMKPKVII